MKKSRNFFGGDRRGKCDYGRCRPGKTRNVAFSFSFLILRWLSCVQYFGFYYVGSDSSSTKKTCGTGHQRCDAPANASYASAFSWIDLHSHVEETNHVHDR